MSEFPGQVMDLLTALTAEHPWLTGMCYGLALLQAMLSLPRP